MRFLFVFLAFNLFAADEERLKSALQEAWKEPKPLALFKIGGGLTNENYLVSRGETSYFVRCSAPSNNLIGASLEREWIVSSIASRAGLAPKTHLYLPKEGLMVSEFVKESGDEIDLRRPLFQKKLCKSLRKLHSLKEKFPTEFCPFECIDSYVKNLREVKGVVPAVFLEKIAPKIQALKNSLQTLVQKVPCHLDLHHGNVIYDGNSIYLVDWEYSAMADPLFDLATAASVDLFSDEEMKELLGTYLQRKPSKEEFDKFYRMRILADARWALWSYLQLKISPLDGPFQQMGDEFLRECLERANKVS